jgi:hypothetical protein
VNLSCQRVVLMTGCGVSGVQHFEFFCVVGLLSQSVGQLRTGAKYCTAPPTEAVVCRGILPSSGLLRGVTWFDSDV